MNERAGEKRKKASTTKARREPVAHGSAGGEGERVQAGTPASYSQLTFYLRHAPGARGDEPF